LALPSANSAGGLGASAGAPTGVITAQKRPHTAHGPRAGVAESEVPGQKLTHTAPLADAGGAEPMEVTRMNACYPVVYSLTLHTSHGLLRLSIEKT